MYAAQSITKTDVRENTGNLSCGFLYRVEILYICTLTFMKDKNGT